MLSSKNKSSHPDEIFTVDGNEIKAYDLGRNKIYTKLEIPDVLLFDFFNSTVHGIEKYFKSSSTKLILREKVQPKATGYDYLTDKFYVLDDKAETINIIDSNGNFAILLSDLEDLHDIILDVEDGFMFIVQYGKSVIFLLTFSHNAYCNNFFYEIKHFQVLRYCMDGTNRQEITKDKNVTAIAIDRVGKKIFWSVLSEGIVTLDYDGEEQVLLKESPENILCLTFYRDQLFWLNGHYEAVTCKIKEKTCSEQKVPTKSSENFGTLSTPKIIKTNYVINSTTNKNPCKINNGGCSHFCLVNSKESKSCACPPGYQLKSDLLNCTFVLDFILYVRSNYVRGVNVHSNQFETFKDWIIPTYLTENLKNQEIFPFDYDLYNDDFYFCHNKEVKSMKLARRSRLSTLFKSEGGCEDLTFDGKNFYYVANNSLEVKQKVNESNVLQKKINNTQRISHFTIDLLNEKIYFVNSTGNLYSMYTNGSNLTSQSIPERLWNAKSISYAKNSVYFLKNEVIVYKRSNSSSNLTELKIMEHKKFMGIDGINFCIQAIQKAFGEVIKRLILTIKFKSLIKV